MIQHIKNGVIGIIECLVASLDVKFLQRNKKLLCLATSFIYIHIWGYVVRYVNEITTYPAFLIYALGYCWGNVLAIDFDNYLERIAKARGIRLRKKRKSKIRRKR